MPFPIGDCMKRAVLLLVVPLAVGCANDPLKGLTPGTGPAVSDTDLQVLIQPAGTWKYFKNLTTPFARASTSPHPESFIRVRYNTYAATQLEANGRIKANASFPDSSVIVKELSNGTTISTYAVMMKLNGSSSAGFGGWIWAEYKPGGATQYSTTGRGAACSACHSQGIDYTRMNDSHP